MSAFMDTMTTYFQRSTDRPLYEAHNVVEFQNGQYVAVNPLSAPCRSAILERLSGPDQAAFLAFLSHWGDEHEA